MAKEEEQKERERERKRRRTKYLEKTFARWCVMSLSKNIREHFLPSRSVHRRNSREERAVAMGIDVFARLKMG